GRRRTRRSGTLSALEDSPRLEGLARKAGTVRDARSRPRLGWIVAVDADFVIVRARAGRMPRSFAADIVELLGVARDLAGSAAAEVQVFGLLDAAWVEASCGGVGIALAGGVPRIADGFRPLRELTSGGSAI